MSAAEPMTSLDERLAAMLRRHEVEQFYFAEAALLDQHRYADWVELFAEDAHYVVPIRRTRSKRELDREFTGPGEMAFMDDDLDGLRSRVAKLASGRAWAEDPPSRTRHLITNVQVIDETDGELAVRSNFLLYRTRLKSEETTWVGSRHDVLRRHHDTFRIASRTVLLEQTVILARNLSNFF